MLTVEKLLSKDQEDDEVISPDLEGSVNSADEYLKAKDNMDKLMRSNRGLLSDFSSYEEDDDEEEEKTRGKEAKKAKIIENDLNTGDLCSPETMQHEEVEDDEAASSKKHMAPVPTFSSGSCSENEEKDVDGVDSKKKKADKHAKKTTESSDAENVVEKSSKVVGSPQQAKNTAENNSDASGDESEGKNASEEDTVEIKKEKMDAAESSSEEDEDAVVAKKNVKNSPLKKKKIKSESSSGETEKEESKSSSSDEVSSAETDEENAKSSAQKNKKRKRVRVESSNSDASSDSGSKNKKSSKKQTKKGKKSAKGAGSDDDVVEVNFTFIYLLEDTKKKPVKKNVILNAFFRHKTAIKW